MHTSIPFPNYQPLSLCICFRTSVNKTDVDRQTLHHRVIITNICRERERESLPQLESSHQKVDCDRRLIPPILSELGQIPLQTQYCELVKHMYSTTVPCVTSVYLCHHTCLYLPLVAHEANYKICRAHHIIAMQLWSAKSKLCYYSGLIEC